MIPKQYAWLLKEHGPQMILQGLAIYGVTEFPGVANNPEILAWAKEVGVQNVYQHDATAWCGLCMGVIAKRSGKVLPFAKPADMLWALNWGKFGKPTPIAMLGDVLTFKRFNAAGKLIGGHVGIYVGEDATAFHVLGGNTMDAVKIARLGRSRLAAIRRPAYKVQPANVRRIVLAATGAISTNEA